MTGMELSRLGLQPHMQLGIESHGANMHSFIEVPLVDPSLAPLIGLIATIAPALIVAAIIWRREDKRAKSENRPQRF